MTKTEKHFRIVRILVASLGCLAGCQTDGYQKLIQKDEGVIATDVALNEATSLPSPNMDMRTNAMPDPPPNQNHVELAAFQSADGLGPVALSSAVPPSPIRTVGQNAMTLEAIQDLALVNNPAIRALSASAQAEQDYQYQVGRSANPEVGYAANQLADQRTDQHLLYVQREFVTANKLQANQDVLSHSAEAQRWDVESQRFRVLTDVRLKFIQALVAQRQMEMIGEFHEVISRGVELAQKRFEAKETSQADVLQTEIQLNEIEVLRQQAEYRLRAAWKEMVAAAGVPELQQSSLDGVLSPARSEINWDGIYSDLAEKSPELQAANSRVRLARSNLSRQEVQAIPNITGNLQAGVDNGTGSGLIQLQVGAPIPVFNDNRGNISAAYNEYSRATHEVKRVQMSLQSRLAQVSQDFDSAKVAVDRYEQQILPKAQQTLSLAEKAYGAGEFSFIQTLIARRTYFDANFNYLTSLGNLSQAEAKVDGLLLTGALEATDSRSLGDSLRGQTFSQQ